MRPHPCRSKPLGRNWKRHDGPALANPACRGGARRRPRSVAGGIVPACRLRVARGRKLHARWRPFPGRRREQPLSHLCVTQGGDQRPRRCGGDGRKRRAHLRAAGDRIARRQGADHLELAQHRGQQRHGRQGPIRAVLRSRQGGNGLQRRPPTGCGVSTSSSPRPASAIFALSCRSSTSGDTAAARSRSRPGTAAPTNTRSSRPTRAPGATTRPGRVTC